MAMPRVTADTREAADPPARASPGCRFHPGARKPGSQEDQRAWVEATATTAAGETPIGVPGNGTRRDLVDHEKADRISADISRIGSTFAETVLRFSRHGNGVPSAANRGFPVIRTRCAMCPSTAPFDSSTKLPSTAFNDSIGFLCILLATRAQRAHFRGLLAPS